MSVMQRNAYGGTVTGEPLPIAPAQLQRQAVIDQLGTPAPASTLTPGVGAAFQRGGQVSQLPSGGAGAKVGGIGVGGASQVANKVLSTSATGAAAGAGIGIGTSLLADKIRTKEEQPTFGGENGAITDDYGRRFQTTGGGATAGAVRGAGVGANPGLIAATGGLSVVGGAAIGAGIAAAKKHAPSAYSDFRVEDAADAINKEYQRSLGRPASQDEIQAQLVGQGWDPTGGDRWVGEKGLYSVLGSIRDSPEAQAFRTRGAVVDQLGTSPAGAGPQPTTTVPADATRELPPVPGAGGAGGASDLETRLGLPPGSIQTATTGGGGSAPQAPPGDVGPTVTFPGSDIPVPLTNAQNEATLAAQPANTQHWTGVEAGSSAAPASPAAGGAAGAAPPSGADTDGYAAPAYVPSSVGQAPPGWDANKWNDPNHQSPKYGVGRILSQFPPTVDGLRQAAEQIAKAYPGATFNGKDTITIPGLGPIDVLKGAGNGGEAWQWMPKDGGGEGGGTSGGGAAGVGAVDTSQAASGPDLTGGGDMLARIRAELQRIMAGSGPNRDALLNQMGGGHG